MAAPSATASTPIVLGPSCTVFSCGFEWGAGGLSAPDARHAAARARPDLALRRHGQRIHVVFEQALDAPDVLPALAVPTLDAAVGAEPQCAVRVLCDRIDDVAGQAVLGTEVDPALAVEAGHAAAPGAGPHRVVGRDVDREHVVGVVGRAALVHRRQVMARARAQPGVGAVGELVRVGRTQAILVGPAFPGLAVEQRDAALGAEPDPVLAVDAQAVDPLVDQLAYIGGELAALRIDLAGAGPGADPQCAVLLR